MGDTPSRLTRALTQVGDGAAPASRDGGSMTIDVGLIGWDEGVSGGDGFVVPTGTVAFLLTDVEGSTHAWEAEPDAMALAMERHDAILDVAVAARGGARPLAQGEGDSIVAAFPRASDAVLAALDAQRSLVAEDWPTSLPLRVRMAVHAGEARTLPDGAYAGQAIIRTARLRAIAHGGQVLVSQPARDLTVDHLGEAVVFEDLGEHRLRDLARPERVYQLLGPGLPDDFAPLQSLDLHRHNLPVQLSTFIGRREEMASVARLLEVERLVTIVGAGGSGKTRLAHQVAAEVIDRNTDGTWWVELAEVRDAALLADAIAKAAGVRGAEGGTEAADALARVLADQSLLLVLDNCEHLIDDVAMVVDRLLRACPSLRVLTTSREPLDLPGEVAWRIPPLGVPIAPAADGAVGAIGQADSVRLFLDRAQRVRPNFHLTDANAPTVAALCVRLDGVPLAVELAAARCRTLTPEQILGGLTDAFRMLSGTTRGALPRQATIGASIKWSHDLLSHEESVLFRRMSVFNGGGVLDDVEAICSDDVELPGSLVLDTLDRLVAQSLVHLDDRGEVSRYRLLEVVRQYAAGRLDDANEAGPLRARHADRFLDVTERAIPDIVHADQLPITLWLCSELDNLIVALESLAATERWDDYARLGRHVAMMCAGFSTADSSAILRRFGDRQATDPVVQGDMHVARICLESMTFDLAMLGSAQATVAYCDAVGYDLGTIFGRSIQALAIGSAFPDQMTGYLDETVALAEHCGPRAVIQAMVMKLGVDGLVAADLGRVDEPWVVATLRPIPEPERGMVWCQCWTLLSLTRFQAGDLGGMEGALRESGGWLAGMDRTVPALARGMRSSLFGSLYGFARALHDTATATGPVDVGGLAHAYGLACREDHLPGCFNYGAGYGVALLVEGDATAALQVCLQVAERFPATVFPYYRSVVDVLAGIAALGEEPAVSRERLAAAGAAASHAGYRWVEGLALVGSGWSALVHDGDIDAAHRAGLDALAWNHEHGFRLLVVDSLELLAACSAADGDHRSVARLAGSAAGARAGLGYLLRYPVPGRELDAAVAATRAAIGDEAYEALALEGGRFDLDAAVEWASRARGERRVATVGWASLTPTEREVVASASDGLTNPQIAAKLLMSRDTVKTHLRHVYAKLGVANRTELATAALREGGLRHPPG